MAQDQGLLKFIANLPEKPSTTVRIFEFTEFYALYYSDATLAAKEIFKTITAVKTIKSEGKEDVEYITLSKIKFENFVKDLLLYNGYRVEIYKNVGHSKTQDWTLDCKASPGNLSQIEDILFSSQELSESKGILAIKIGSTGRNQAIGVAYIDNIQRKFQITEFVDNEYFSNLQSLLVHLNPKEVLISSEMVLNAKLKETVSKHNLLLTECKPSDFVSKDLTQDLKRILKTTKDVSITVSLSTELENKLAMSGICAILKYLELLSDESNFNHYTLTTFSLEQYAKLDNAAVKALSLLPVPTYTNKKQSLLGLLNLCRTAPGQRLCNQWIKQPLLDVNKIEERLNIVEALVGDTELRHGLYEEHLRKFPDVHQLSKKFLKKKSTLQDCYKVYQGVNSISALNKCINNYSGPYLSNFTFNFTDPLKELQNDFQKYIDMVESTLDLNLVESGQYLVKSDFDKDLQGIKEEITEIEGKIQADFKVSARSLGLEMDKSIKLETCNQIGYAYRVTRKEEKVLRNKKGFITIDAKQNGVRFHSSALKELNSTYITLRDSYEEHQKALVQMIIEIASGYNEPLLQLGDTIAHLDVLVAFAEAAVSAPKPYVRPKIHELGAGKLILKQARHPCLEFQDNIDFIPNDITMEKDKENFNIITGPNMGGKSTYIRSIALNVLMAQIGSFVACEEADISVMDAILTRVGAGDVQLKGVSTFMAEMLESANILRVATDNSLVIIDELGRGTSTYDGFGLAWAISEHLAKEIKAYCLFATHFHEMTALASQIPTVKNYHVTALTTSNELTFLYTLKPGMCDQSFGVHVAEMANFPKHIIDLAKIKVKEFEEYQVASVLIDEASEPDRKKVKLDEELEAQKIIDDFLEKCKALKDKSPEDMQKAVEALKQDVLAKDNSYIKNLIESLN